MKSRSNLHPHPRHPGSRRLSGTHWKTMQGAAWVSFPRQRLRLLRHPAPLLNGSRVKPGMTWRCMSRAHTALILSVLNLPKGEGRGRHEVQKRQAWCMPSPPPFALRQV